MTTSINIFVADPAFTNSSTPYVSRFNVGGIATLSQLGLSYFVDLVVDQDDRVPTTRTVAWAATLPSSILVDNSFYQQFVTDLSNAPDAVRQSVFAILDRILYDSTASDSTETFLTTDSSAKVAYVPGSFVPSSSNITGTVYSTAVPAGVPYSCPAFVVFSVLIPTGSVSTQYDITSYADNTTWLKDYPESTIQAVVPPVDYNDLLTANLTTSLVNLFSATSASALLNSAILSPSLDAIPSSGYIVYRATVIDTDGTTTVAPFNILYKGAVPSQLAIRNAVKAAVLASGGTAAAWQARIPGLFVSSRYYLVPLWDLTQATTGSKIFSNIVNVNTIIAKIDRVLAVLDRSVIATYLEILEAAYNRILIASVPDVSGTDTTTSLNSIYPSYQCYGASDANFSYMSADTQAFALALASVLAVEVGNVSSTTYVPTQDRNLEYISFTEGEVEFCVVTQNGYAALVSEAS